MVGKIKKGHVILTITPFFLILVYLCGASHGATIRIGALFDLSGPNRELGNAMLFGANSAVKIWNPSLSNLGHQLEIAVVDTGSEEGRLLLGAMRLDKQKGAMVLIGPTEPQLAKVLMGYSEAHEIPTILVSGHQMLLPTPWEKIKWSYGVAPGIGDMARSLYRKLEKQGIKLVGILLEDTPIFKTDVRWLKGYATEYKMRIVSIDGFSPQDIDCISQLQHLKDSGAKMVIYRGGASFIPRLLHSLKSVSIDVVFLMDTPLDPDKYRQFSTVYPQVYYQSPLLFSQNVDLLPQKLNIIRFKNSLEASTIQSTPKVIAAAMAWDAIGLIVTALKNGATPTRQGFITVLEGRRYHDIPIYLRYHGIIGDYRPDRRNHIGFDPNDLLLRQLH